MQIDRSALEGLLSLNDRQLLTVINKLAAESGIDPSQFNMDVSSVAGIRNAISGASDEELKRIVEQFEAGKDQRGKK